MAPRDKGKTQADDLEALDLDAAIGAAESLAGAVAPAAGLDLEEVLNADSAAGEAALGPRKYDFNRPHSISRGFEQNLQSIAENFAKIATIEFTSLMRMTIQVENRGLRQSTFSEYIGEMPCPTCAAMATMHPLKGYMLVHLDLGLCFIFMKKLMGGAPEPGDSIRDFTEIERGINAGLIGRFTEVFRKSAAKLVDLEPKFVNLENNPNYLSGIAEGESLIILSFRVKLETVDAPLELVFPLSAFGPVKDILDPQESADLRTPAELREDRRRILDMVRTTGSELVAILGEIDSNLEEVMKLSEGDLLHLPQAVTAPLVVKIEGEDSWLGEAGRLNQSRAVQLIQRLTKE